jgi:Golgi phosphoprotein 3
MVPLTLAEQLILLALDDETGKLCQLPDRALDYGLAGAILAELTRAGRIEVSGKAIRVLDRNEVQSAPEDRGLREIIAQDARTLDAVLSHLAGDSHNLRHHVTRGLVEKGVLREVGKEILWVFHYSRYPLADPQSEMAIRERVRSLVLNASSEISPRQSVLISLIHACDLGDILFSEAELEHCQERIAAICHNDAIGSAVMQCLQEIQRAILEIRTYSGM